MEDEPRWSNGTIVMLALWAFTVFVLACSWSLWVIVGAEIRHLPILFGETACILSAVAAVAQIRCYVARVCATIRLASGQWRQDEEPSRLGPRR